MKSRLSYRRRRDDVSRSSMLKHGVSASYFRWAGQKNIKAASPSTRRQRKGGEA